MPRLDLATMAQLAGGITHADIRAAKCARSFAAFVRAMWDVVEPSMPLRWGPHLDAICLHLEAVADGRITRLIVNVPPGHAKSLLVSVFFPAWQWLKQPGWRALCGSYALELSVRDAVRCRALMQSDEYQNVLRRVSGQRGVKPWAFSSDSNVKSLFNNDAAGFRLAVSVGGRATGFRGDAILIDDVLNIKEGLTGDRLKEARDWINVSLSSRLNDLKKGVKIIIGQRVHEADPCAELIQRKIPGTNDFEYDLVALPSQYDPGLYASLGRSPTTSIGWSDWRTVPGEPLFPALFPPEVLAQVKQDLGSANFAAQHQQRPSPAGGGFVREEWLRFWVPHGVDMPPPHVVRVDGKTYECEQVRIPDTEGHLLSADLSFKGAATSDFCALQIWANGTGNLASAKFLISQTHKRMDFVETLKTFETICAQWPELGAKLIEDAANGPAIISTLKTRMGGVIAVRPDGGKEARLSAVTPMIEAGNVYFPHPHVFPWVNVLIAELLSFPKAAHDDQVDALSMALNRLKKRITVV